ncbi:hypothetical protein SAMN05421647_11485 [Marinobacterium stanieri]|uniref:Uncharacterized protein n=1 Tax=Marinobacterium stanieri TaxID=49186 RepID=A0A1N6XL88_9GAMM|nr:hypothetical protein SAMN05421647_11485 [Marinobacterium stanieri]
MKHAQSGTTTWYADWIETHGGITRGSQGWQYIVRAVFDDILTNGLTSFLIQLSLRT